MTRSPKLNDMQLILLTTACQRDDGSLLPPPDSIGVQGARIRKAVAVLIKRALATEVDISDAAHQWRQEDDRHIGVVITDAGRAIIAAEEAEEEPATPVENAATTPEAAELPVNASCAPPKPGSKIAMVIELLRRDAGVTLEELIAATGWLPHTTRAALTGLRKKGHAVTRTNRDGATCYNIAMAA